MKWGKAFKYALKAFLALLLFNVLGIILIIIKILQENSLL